MCAPFDRSDSLHGREVQTLPTQPAITFGEPPSGCSQIPQRNLFSRSTGNHHRSVPVSTPRAQVRPIARGLVLAECCLSWSEYRARTCSQSDSGLPHRADIRASRSALALPLLANDLQVDDLALTASDPQTPQAGARPGGSNAGAPGGSSDEEVSPAPFTHCPPRTVPAVPEVWASRSAPAD